MYIGEAGVYYARAGRELASSRVKTVVATIWGLPYVEYTQIQRLQHISEFDLSQFYLTSPIREKVNTLTSPVGDEI